MTRTRFWQLIQSSLETCGGDIDEQEATLRNVLQRLNAEEIVSFYTHFAELLREAYSWDLWGAAFIIGGGCSDDGFEYFRRWLVSCGQYWFERELKNSDDLADYPEELSDERMELEGILYVAPALYKEKFGPFPYPEIASDGEIKGTDWEEDEEVFRSRWPKLRKVLVRGVNGPFGARIPRNECSAHRWRFSLNSLIFA